MVNLMKIAGRLVEDAFRWLLVVFRSAEALRAENLFLRRQLAAAAAGLPYRSSQAAFSTSQSKLVAFAAMRR
jgi:hypothetical protein